MHYNKYIELGFERIDLNDNVEFKQTGYHGFTLEIQLTKNVSISVNSGELDNPKMFIRKDNSENNFIINLEEDQIREILQK